MSKTKTSIFIVNFVVDLEQLITSSNQLFFFKQIVLYVWRTSDDRSYLIS